MGFRLAKVLGDECRFREGFASPRARLYERNVAAQPLLGLDDHEQFRDQKTRCQPCS